MPRSCGKVVDTLEVKLDTSKGLKVPSADDMRTWIDSVRKGELVTLVIGRERRVLVDRIQATMAVVEGHAEHVMDAVGAEVIPAQAELREALERRRMDRSGPMRLLERVLGFELKLRQYRDGKRFCDAVVAKSGIEGLNRVWSAPHQLPTLAESVDPDAWIARQLFRLSQSRAATGREHGVSAVHQPLLVTIRRRHLANRRSLLSFVKLALSWDPLRLSWC